MTIDDVKTGEIFNISNFKCGGAKINDRGPYANDKNGNPRIADLTLAVSEAIDIQTDQDLVEITIL